MTIHCVHSRLVPTSELSEKRHPKNPNTHSAAQIAAYAQVVEGNGIRRTVVLSRRSGLITRGHGLLEAALLLGYDNLPVDDQDYADEAAEIADMLADNRWVDESAHSSGIQFVRKTRRTRI